MSFGGDKFRGNRVSRASYFGVVAFRGCRYLGRCIFESLHFEVIACQGRRVLQSFEVVEFWGQILGSSNFGGIELWVVEFPGCQVARASSFRGNLFWGCCYLGRCIFEWLHFEIIACQGRRISGLSLFESLHF